MDGTSQPPKKPGFMELFVQSQLGRTAAWTVAALAHVPVDTVNEMFMGHPVSANDAQAVLTFMGRHVGKHLTLDDVNIPVLPKNAEEIQHG